MFSWSIFQQWAAWYLAVCGGIFIVFERAEKFSNKNDLDQYYLLLTVRREIPARSLNNSSNILRGLIGSDFEKGKIVFPKILNIFIYTMIFNIPNLILSSERSRGKNLSTAIAITFTIFCISFLLDYAIFTKTGTIVKFALKKPNFIRTIILMIMDITLTILLIFGAIILFEEIRIFATQSIPFFTSKILSIPIAIENGIPNWNETFYWGELDGPIAIILLISSFFSLIITFGTVLSLVIDVSALKIAQFIPKFQEFIDRHTSVLDKPLQIISLICVLLFSVIFWLIYILYYLIVNK